MFKTGSTGFKKWLNVRCLPTDEWIKKLCYLYMVEYYSAIKRNTRVHSNEVDEPRAYDTE